MATTKQPAQKLGMFQAVATAAAAPIKGAAIGGIFIGEVADALWGRRQYVADCLRNTVDLVVLTAAAASRKAKAECLGQVNDVTNVDQTLADIETYWETK